MRILLVLGRYLPDKSAGIENYSHWLADVLIQNNHTVEVAILGSPYKEPYTYESVKVFPLRDGFAGFIQLIEDTRYDICHFQEYSGKNGINIQWFQVAKKYCGKVFFTFHLPYLTCYKNDFRYKGITDCNNFSSSTRCLECIIATKLNFKKKRGISLKNLGINLITPLLKKSDKVQKLKERIEGRTQDLKQLINICDQIFIYGAWFEKLLIENGYNSDKIELIPHISKVDIERKQRDEKIKNRILFVGRIEKVKGLHLLTKAMHLISTKEIELEVAGNVVDESYFESCKKQHSFTYKGVVPRLELLRSFPDYDFLVLPSVFTEMYSLVVKESLYEKLPVIASAAKGNKDVIIEGKNGFIFNYNDPEDLARVLDEAYHLKQKGWQPEFETNYSPENDLKKVLSYYKS